MCGIAGLQLRDGHPDEQTLAVLAEALGHRGPDGDGRLVSGNTALLHQRLAIIDVAGGRQPLAEDGGAALIANGEIYNYRELREQMPGVNFRTGSDCEPALHLFRKLGTAFVKHLRGMYAIAIYDPREGTLVVTRDPFGIKPLYYAEGDYGFAFASEPRALLAAGLGKRAVNDRTRRELLQLQFTTGAETIFPGIRRVLPGETITVTNGRIVSRERHDALPAGGPAEWTEEDALERLDAALLDSVNVHQRSDVPYGMFLSGGIDSAAVLSLMSRLNDRPVLAFTAGFPDLDGGDERNAARAIARALGARHEEVEVTARDFHELLPQVAAAMDDPAADYAVLPTYKLAAAARREVKVILSGEGGDEMFAGYGRYRSVMRPFWFGGRTVRARGIFDGLGVLRISTTGWRDGIAAAEARASARGGSRLQIAQAVDFADWLPNDLLGKLDRCLMAHGLEGRTPFLDPAVAQVAFRLPDRLKIRRGLGKWLLRKWLSERVPAADAFGSKRGFTVPVGAWMAADGARLGPLVANVPAVREIAEQDRVKRLFVAQGKRERFAAWTMLFYALWHRAHILGKAPDGDLAHCLAES
ncbi:MAG: asparagine synthase (glutamine-hydrolyzing) [Gemmatimonas sp.]